MKLGTRSVIYGVHQFLFHPLTVAISWRRLYGRWPNWWQSVAILLHDAGYVGKSAMDSEDGITHPELGAKWTAKVVGWFAPQLTAAAHDLALYHSSHYARKAGQPVSALYLPDKAAVLVEPVWFYLLRARLSGEIKEYVVRESDKVGFDMTQRGWLLSYREHVREKVRGWMIQRAASVKPCKLCHSK